MVPLVRIRAKRERCPPLRAGLVGNEGGGETDICCTEGAYGAGRVAAQMGKGRAATARRVGDEAPRFAATWIAMRLAEILLQAHALWVKRIPPGAY